MYDTHLNDLAQLSAGLYGALIVVPEGATFDSENDKVLSLSPVQFRANAPIWLHRRALQMCRHYSQDVYASHGLRHPLQSGYEQ